ncbi:integrase core domain-containing protein [Synechococcus sp. HK05]|uniref:integrase core domain-containing protein n=1 Tax=Synechococcus sp. HK05 TaxID=2725975 RepID=UPI0034CFD1D4
MVHALRTWCKNSGTATTYIEPGSPWQNGIVESFNRRFRDEYLIVTDPEAQGLAIRWRWEYNTLRPPFSSPGGYAPGGRSSSCCMTTHSHCSWTMKGVTSSGI